MSRGDVIMKLVNGREFYFMASHAEVGEIVDECGGISQAVCTTMMWKKHNISKDYGGTMGDALEGVMRSKGRRVRWGDALSGAMRSRSDAIDEKNYDVNDDACEAVLKSQGVDENDEKKYDESDDACEAVLKSAGVDENDENYDKLPDVIGKDYVCKLRKYEGRCARGVMRSRGDALEG